MSITTQARAASTQDSHFQKLKHFMKGKSWSEEVFSIRSYLLSLDSVAQIANQHIVKLFFVENTGLALFPVWKCQFSILFSHKVFYKYLYCSHSPNPTLTLLWTPPSYATRHKICNLAAPTTNGAGISSHRLDKFHPESPLSAWDKWQPDDNLFLITTLPPH